MEDIRTAQRLLRRGDFMASIDLQDAYFAVPVHKNSRKLLKFKFKEVLYQFTCLPFGLCSSPYVFTKLMKPVISHLRELGFLSVIYLDDILCIGESFEDCLRNVRASIKTLESLGFLINYEKSKLVPLKIRKFLGFELDSEKMMLYIPQERKREIRMLVTKFLRLEKIQIRKFASLIGSLVAVSHAVRYAWLYIKRMERLRYISLLKNNGRYESVLRLSIEAREDLIWWRDNILNAESPIKEDIFDCVIFTDASTTGWGAVLGDKRIFGFWSKSEIECSSIGRESNFNSSDGIRETLVRRGYGQERTFLNFVTTQISTCHCVPRVVPPGANLGCVRLLTASTKILQCMSRKI
ncbi:uncharacterized protein [Prorops nasuta]|uniref:uncharacterized protein isoform X2 n=1 Tax=Prorops nasuta TaxID=863751 RepID=UPI0034CF8826